MIVREVSITEHWEAAVPLMRANWAETGSEYAMAFAPSKEFYVRLQNAGIVLAVGAFFGTGLVGYCTAFVGPHPFNPAVKVCSTDSLYLAPDLRGGLTAGRMVAKVEALARERECVAIMWHTRAGTGLAKVMAKHGYVPCDEIVMRRL